MAITRAVCTAFKQALMDGEMDFSSDTADVFKIALYTEDAVLSADTSAYTDTEEITGTGYTAGGATLSPVAPVSSGATVVLDFADVTWSTATFSARGALIYKSGGANTAIAVLDFGSNVSVSSGNFTVNFPTADASRAILRVT